MRDVIFRMTALTASVVGSFVITVMAQTSPDSLSGGAGWASFGIAGLVLAWLLLVRLPAQDRLNRDLADQMSKDREKMEARYDAERDAERKARHDRQDQFQAMLNKMAVGYETSIKTMQDQHSMDMARMQENIKSAQEQRSADMARMQEQHLRDANADREAFVQRQDRTEDVISKAIQSQTMSLELAIIKAVNGVCKADCGNFRPSRPATQQDQT